MDSIDTKSKVSSTAVIPSGGTRKSRSGGGGEGEISFASLLNGGGFGDIKSGGGLQSGLEDSLGSALERNPDEAPEKAPERAAKHDYNDDTSNQSNDDGYYNKSDNNHDGLNDRQDDVPHDDTVVTSAKNDHSADYDSTDSEPATTEAQSSQQETPDNNDQSTGNDGNETGAEQSAGETDVASTDASNTNANAKGGATVETLNELAQNQALPEQAAAVASAQGKEVQGRANATDGLNNAAAAISADKAAKPASVKKNNAEQNTANQGKAGENLNQPLETAGKEKIAKTTNAATANANAAVKPQDQLQNQQAAQPKAETQMRETSNVAKQAAEISRAIGGDKELSVNVSVQSEKDTLVSRPRSSLSLATDASKGNATPNNANTGSGQGQNQSANNQMAQQNMAMAAQQAQAQAKQGPTGGVNNAVNATNAITGAQASSGAGGDAGGVNSTPSFSETLNARQAAAPAKTPGAQQNAPAPKSPATEQVSVQITKAINAGADKINIHLRPASLGRVDVQIEMGMDGRVSAVVTADNKDTLDLLQRDQRALERALQDAGLKADSGSLSFNLRGGGEGGNANGEESNPSGRAPLAKPEIEEEPLESLLSAQFNKQEKGIGDGRIDIHA
ncbi:MAG: flagellar hook-length control protein FliK [Rhodospirillaceae bacterium]|nr:flagellar hook-length control protein FliK [Rhodospirillaceae bacterium]